MTTIRFTAADLDLFSAASHDRNPLHISDEYTRRTAYGSRVVFGVLNSIAALGKARLDKPDRGVLSSIECEFFDAALMGVDYGVTIDEESSETVIRVSDGRRPVLEAVLSFGSGQREKPPQANATVPLCHEAADLQASELTVGRRVAGRYATSRDEVTALCAWAGLSSKWATSPALSALMWTSYIIGMELPGRRALFSRLRIEFGSSGPASTPFDYHAEICEISDAGELTIRASLSSEGRVWAKAQLNAYVREDIHPATTENVQKLVGRSESLLGRVAFVSGGSRGLGAALVRALALHGCTVLLNFVQGVADAETVRDSLTQAPGKVLLEQGDIGDVAWCIELQERLRTTLKRLDFLICNASPTLLPLWLEPSAAARIDEFIRKSVAMVTSPMAALMPVVADTRGWNVLISSSAVNRIHPHFPHYTSAKAAAEAMVRAGNAEYRSVSSLIVRPSRLLTDLTNTPLGRRGAMTPELVAAAVVEHIQGPPCPGTVEIMDQFPNSRGIRNKTDTQKQSGTS